MRTLLLAYAAGGSQPIAQLADELIPEFRREIEAHRANDDLLDVIHVAQGAVTLTISGSVNPRNDMARALPN